jgi:transposase-like protein
LEVGERAVEPELDPKVREALAMFADEISAHRYLERVLWPDGVCCPRCGDHGRVSELNGASTRLGTYKCYQCRRIFSILHGTFMSASHVPAHKWLQAMYLTEGGTRPIRALHLARILNVSFKTASAIMRRIADATRPSAASLDDAGAVARRSVDFAVPVASAPPSKKASVVAPSDTTKPKAEPASMSGRSPSIHGRHGTADLATS